MLSNSINSHLYSLINSELKTNLYLENGSSSSFRNVSIFLINELLDKISFQPRYILINVLSHWQGHSLKESLGMLSN